MGEVGEDSDYFTFKLSERIGCAAAVVDYITLHGNEGKYVNILCGNTTCLWTH